MNRLITPILVKLNSNETTKYLLGREFTREDILDMVDKSVDKEIEYLDVKGGVVLKSITDPTIDGLLVVDRAIGAPAREALGPAYEFVRGWIQWNSDLLKPITDPAPASTRFGSAYLSSSSSRWRRSRRRSASIFSSYRG